MSTTAIVLVVLVVALVALAVGGAVARRRQLDATSDDFARHLDQVNHDLAAAHAADNGWDASRLEAAARAAWASRTGSDPDEVTLWEVIDRPGTDADQAVYRVTGGGSEALITLDRTGDEWHPAPEHA
jgi:hypothetical protein